MPSVSNSLRSALLKALPLAALSVFTLPAFAGNCSIYAATNQNSFIHLGTYSKGNVHYGPSLNHEANPVQAGWLSKEGRLIVHRPMTEPSAMIRTRDVGYIQGGSAIIEDREVGQRSIFGQMSKVILSNEGSKESQESLAFVAKGVQYITLFVDHDPSSPCTNDEKAGAASLLFFYDVLRANDVKEEKAPKKALPHRA